MAERKEVPLKKVAEVGDVYLLEKQKKIFANECV